MRKVLMEIECSNSIEPATKIKVAHSGNWSKLVCARQHRRSQAKPVLNRYAETLHQGTGIFPKTLLTRDQWVAMMGVLHLALIEVRGHAHVVMRRQQKATSLSRQKFLDCFDFFARRLLLGDHMVQAKDHHRIRVCKNAIINRQLLTGLIYSLINRNGISCNFLGETLKSYCRQMEQLQCSRNSLQEHLF